MRRIPNFIRPLINATRSAIPGFTRLEPSLNPRDESRKRNVYMHTVSSFRLNGFSTDGDSSNDAFQKLLSTGRMEVLDNSGRGGRADAVFTIPICLDAHPVRQQSAILSDFILNDSGSCGVIFDSPQPAQFRPHGAFCGLCAAWHDGPVMVNHIISRNADGHFVVHNRELWSQLVEQMDLEIKEHLESIDVLCATFGLNMHGNLEDKIERISQALIDSPEVQSEKFSESVTALKGLTKACVIINEISAREGTYLMTNALVSSAEPVKKAESDSDFDMKKS